MKRENQLRPAEPTKDLIFTGLTTNNLLLFEKITFFLKAHADHTPQVTTVFLIYFVFNFPKAMYQFMRNIFLK